MYDQAFERYVPLQQISTAWRELDLDVLIDCAIELVDAERHFCRNHRIGITAADLLSLTLELATRMKREDVLSRLGRVLAVVETIPLADKVEHGLNAMTGDTSTDFSANYDALVQSIVSEANPAKDESQSTSAAAALQLDRLSRFHAYDSSPSDEKEIVYVDFEGREGTFFVKGNDNLGVRGRNTGFVRRFRFHVTGRWSYAPDKWFNYKGDPDFQAPDYSPGNNYWLPGANVGSLLAWGGRVPAPETLEDKGMEVQLTPRDQVMFIMNDNSVRPGGFRDNAGQLDVRWEEIDPIYP